MPTIFEIIEQITPKALELTRIYLPDENISINYVAIFSQNNDEYESFSEEASQAGKIVDDTPTGYVYQLTKPLPTVAGPLQLVKIRKPDPTRPQRGDADFTLENYQTIKERFLSDKSHFQVIDRGHFEMLELRDQKFDVLVYFSDIPLTAQLGIV